MFLGGEVSDEGTGEGIGKRVYYCEINRNRKLALKTGSIRQTIFVKASPEEVYDALVDSRKHSEFTGSPATSEMKVGGKFTAWDEYITGKHLELVRAKKIVQEWKTTEWPRGYPPSRLQFTISRKRGGTELKMVHSKVPAEQVAQYKEGWVDAYWKPLREYFAKK